MRVTSLVRFSIILLKSTIYHAPHYAVFFPSSWFFLPLRSILFTYYKQILFSVPWIMFLFALIGSLFILEPSFGYVFVNICTRSFNFNSASSVWLLPLILSYSVQIFHGVNWPLFLSPCPEIAFIVRLIAQVWLFLRSVLAVFLNVTSYTLTDRCWRFGGTCCLQLHLYIGDISCSSKTWVTIYQTVRHLYMEDQDRMFLRTVHNDLPDNTASHPRLLWVPQGSLPSPVYVV
jgi:hypothetical protein